MYRLFFIQMCQQVSDLLHSQPFAVVAGAVRKSLGNGINYDLTDVRKAYEAISAEIMEIQMKLDQLNQTVTFDVEL